MSDSLAQENNPGALIEDAHASDVVSERSVSQVGKCTSQRGMVFSKRFTSYCKGVGILLIAIHNYFHIRRGFGLENEMDFDPDHIWNFLGYFAVLNLDQWLAALFGYLGHYGVQLFIFFSAYGLAVQYKKKSESDILFIARRLKKIYFLLFFGVALIVAGSITLGKHTYDFFGVINDSLLLGSTLNSFSRVHLYDLFSGPFWFFGLIIQIYLIFPILYKIMVRLGSRRVVVAFVGTYGLLYFGYYGTLNTDYGVLGSFVGHLPEVLLGIVCAQFGVGMLRLKRLYVFVVVGVFVLSQMYEGVFLLSFLSISVLLVWLLAKIELMLPIRAVDALVFVGKISMMMFVLNTGIRDLHFFDGHGAVYLGLYLSILMVFSYIAWLAYNFLAIRSGIK